MEESTTVVRGWMRETTTELTLAVLALAQLNQPISEFDSSPRALIHRRSAPFQSRSNRYLGRVFSGIGSARRIPVVPRQRHPGEKAASLEEEKRDDGMM